MYAPEQSIDAIAYCVAWHLVEVAESNVVPRYDPCLYIPDLAVRSPARLSDAVIYIRNLLQGLWVWLVRDRLHYLPRSPVASSIPAMRSTPMAFPTRPSSGLPPLAGRRPMTADAAPGFGAKGARVGSAGRCTLPAPKRQNSANAASSMAGGHPLRRPPSAASTTPVSITASFGDGGRPFTAAAAAIMEDRATPGEQELLDDESLELQQALLKRYLESIVDVISLLRVHAKPDVLSAPMEALLTPHTALRLFSVSIFDAVCDLLPRRPTATTTATIGMMGGDTIDVRQLDDDGKSTAEGGGGGSRDPSLFLPAGASFTASAAHASEQGERVLDSIDLLEFAMLTCSDPDAVEQGLAQYRRLAPYSLRRQLSNVVRMEDPAAGGVEEEFSFDPLTTPPLGPAGSPLSAFTAARAVHQPSHAEVALQRVVSMKLLETGGPASVSSNAEFADVWRSVLSVA